MILDTHIVLWAVVADSRVIRVRNILEQSDRPLLVSVASVWEAEIKRAAGKLPPTVDLSHAIQVLGLSTIAITHEDAVLAARLPQHHRDPFDRMIIAQALNRGLKVVTHDRAFGLYDVAVLWA